MAFDRNERIVERGAKITRDIFGKRQVVQMVVKRQKIQFVVVEEK